MSKDPAYASRPFPSERAFVIQLKQEADPAQQLFVGRVVHLTSGEEQRFRTSQEAVSFITRIVADLPGDNSP